MSNWKKGKQLNNGEYVIESILPRSGTGFYYRAKDTKNSQLVTIKAIDIFWREQENGEVLAQKLIQQAQQIANNCQNPNLINLYPQVFLEGKKFYMVMDYLEGIDLATHVDHKGKFEPEEALKLIMKIGSAINVLHQNKSIHQEIKPQNIILDQNSQEPILSDYGSAIKLFALAPRKNQNTMTDSFSSPEQLQKNGKIRPCTDIYSLAATLYVLVTAQLPTSAKFREYKDLIPPQQLNPAISDNFNQAILKGMELNSEKRPQYLRDFFQLFKENSVTINNNTAQQKKISKEKLSAILSQVVTNEETIVQNISPITAPPTIIKPKTNYPNIEEFTFETVTIEQEKKLFGLMSSIKKNLITKTGQFFIEYIGEGVNLDMILIPSGSFMMGSNSNENGRDKDENPQHLVKLNSFYMSKYPITQLQWRTVSSFSKISRPIKNNPSFYKGDNLPVEKVSWLDAQEFCKRLSKYTGRNYRLPTESEWEYACRGNTNTPFFFGETITPDFANYNNTQNNENKKNASKLDKKTTPVDNFYPNPFGLYDFHGNVWEWCEDNYATNYIHKPKNGSAFYASALNQHRVVRGGSWSLSSEYCRSAKRGNYAPDSNYNFIGFRVVCVMDS
ncbi:bifunctional serine/threonine-protein kinase/formylglycine-generating enzyme family protein [Geminocystis sp. GBBB08]|uniref:bifunctional serine/threonine-protein kinase/formylglycine-generating enzyme family protein n=1 Tax=Geminocystis sp. GBBB08 TaxID=2604140 RepID=UPI0027E256CC|nr:bifunctional serine/threonine-protein kinase/formylglycine-generating enzyme family protein [Geminocystis sp. GBBB08]MBL1210808.1 SUMF1/EgtB/PvdO family nonheme iron enzyme [Geminocystis sp. GBBB08]